MPLRTTGRSRRARLLAGLPLVAALCVPAAPAAADDPLFVGWTTALPPLMGHPLPGQYEPTSSDDCTAGRTPCVRKVIREMERRFEPLAAECSHAAVFSLAYLRTTQTYLETAETPGFYDDVAYVNHEDAAFAALYFTAYDDWAAGRVERVPPAWRVAFRAGEERQVSGTGDLLLGMNAHVNRDLPFVLAAVGLVAPDGTSRKPDHDRIDVMLNKVVEPLLAEQAQRFDPGMAAPWTPYGVGYTGLMQTLAAWREAAWRSAELLVAAPDEEARARVAASIEQHALLNAEVIRSVSAYVPPLTSTTDRDRYCAERAGTEDGEED